MGEDELFHITIVFRANGVCDVDAPMHYKEICYNVLKDARTVIDRSPATVFSSIITMNPAIVIVVSKSGRVDVSAPLPPLELCHHMLKAARLVIENYDVSAPPQPLPADMVR